MSVFYYYFCNLKNNMKMEELALHLLDLMQNAIRAEAKNIEVSVTEAPDNRRLTFCVKDDGCGMDAETAARAAVAGFTTKQDGTGGRGLSLLKECAELTGGQLLINSTLGKGSTVTATFGLDHPACKPLGDLAGTFAFTLTSYPDIHFILHYQKKDHTTYSFDTQALYAAIGKQLIQHPQMIAGIKEMIEEYIKAN